VCFTVAMLKDSSHANFAFMLHFYVSLGNANLASPADSGKDGQGTSSTRKITNPTDWIMIYHLLHNRTTCMAGRLFKTSYSLQLQFMIEVKQRKTLTATVTPAFLPICKYWTLLK